MKQKQDITAIIAMKDAETTILHTLESLVTQSYPIQAIIVVDNASKDSSRTLVKKFADSSKIPIRIIARRQNKGVGASFNAGAQRADTDLVVFMHADSELPTRSELSKLVRPFTNQNVIAAYSTILTPRKIWERFNFWEKLLFARVVDKPSPGLNGKFDAIHRETFLIIGGFDDEKYGHDIGIGGEDGDLHLRLLEKGAVVQSKAEVVHLHYLHDDYRLSDFIDNRKLLARSYGRLLQVRKTDVGVGGIVFLVKPLLCIIPLIMLIYPVAALLMGAYLLWYPWRMYAEKSTRNDLRILIVPFITLYLVYAETYWMFDALFTNSIDYRP